MAKTLELKFNEPDEGDDPENRYDCDSCAYPPQPDEYILLVKEDCEITDKFCEECAAEKLTKPTED
jgi:hypothetical protein